MNQKLQWAGLLLLTSLSTSYAQAGTCDALDESFEGVFTMKTEGIHGVPETDVIITDTVDPFYLKITKVSSLVFTGQSLQDESKVTEINLAEVETGCRMTFSEISDYFIDITEVIEKDGVLLSGKFLDKTGFWGSVWETLPSSN